MLVVGYAMSRLDDRYLRARGQKTWKEAFEEASGAFSVPVTSIRNVRDEFDPYHDNPRRGWWNRPMQPSRLRVLEDLRDVSAEALLVLVGQLVARDPSTFADAVEALGIVPRPIHNVAERLLTGRRAEDYFLAHARELVRLDARTLVDRRDAACGYDFAVSGSDEMVVEVKGMKVARGDILFTDREWVEASIRRDNYWLVVVGCLDTTPTAKVIKNPRGVLEAHCVLRTSVVTSWRSRVSV